MTTSQLVTDLKNMIGPGIEVGDPGLITWINDAYMYVVDEIKKVNPDFFTKAATASTAADQQEYALPSDWEQAVMVNINYGDTWTRCLPIPTINNIPYLNRSDDSQGYDVGNPGYYIVGSNIGFLPIPTATNSNYIKLWYTYTPTELSANSDVPAIPNKFHHILKYGAYANYLDQDDEHVAAERMRQRFSARVFDMLESMHTNQLDQPKSVTVTSNQDLYYTDDGWA